MNKLIINLQYLINIMGCLPFIHVSSQEISDNSIQPANQTNNTSSIKINNSILQINKNLL